MGLGNIIETLRDHNPLVLLQILRDWQSYVRLNFLFAAVESGLLEALSRPAEKEELIDRLEVKRPELLEALLGVGLALGELAYDGGLYRVKGRRSFAMMGRQGDVFAALVQANVTYYNAVYRGFAERLRGAPLSQDLGEIGGLVARLSKLAEPSVRRFVRDTVAGKGLLRIFEVGCGAGIYLRSAYQANPNVSGVGIDMDDAVVDQARQNLHDWGIADQFEVMVADIRVPPAGLNGPFDLITLYNIVYYFPVQERVDLFRSLRSLLSSGGAIALVSSMQSEGQDLFAANLNLATSSIAGCTPLPDLDDITAQLRESGFSDIERTKLMPRSALFGVVAS